MKALCIKEYFFLPALYRNPPVYTVVGMIYEIEEEGESLKLLVPNSDFPSYGLRRSSFEVWFKELK